MSNTNSNFHPIVLAPQSDVAPHTYIVIRHVQICDHCGGVHQFSEVHSKTFLRARVTGNRNVTNFRPLKSLNDVTWNLPIELVNREAETVPFCHRCAQAVDLKHLPRPPTEADYKAIIDMGAINNALKTPPRPGDPKPEASEPKATKAKKSPTIDDILL